MCFVLRLKGLFFQRGFHRELGRRHIQTAIRKLAFVALLLSSTGLNRPERQRASPFGLAVGAAAASWRRFLCWGSLFHTVQSPL